MASDLSEHELLLEFMDGLKRAASAAGGMAHYQHNPGWLMVRDMLESCRHNGMAMASKRPLSRQQTLNGLDKYKSGIVVN